MADLMDEAIEISHKLIPCNICGRTFLPSPLKKHAKVCEKNATRKRKTFNSLKQRIDGTELAVFHQKSYLRKSENNCQSVAVPAAAVPTAPLVNATTAVKEEKRNQSKWKEKHEQLVQAIRAAKGEKVMAPRRSISAVGSMGTTEQCPSCDRHFGPKAYDRHVEWCKEHKIRAANKSPAVVTIAKERLEARTKYRVPPLNKSKRSVTREKYASPSSNRNQEAIMNVRSTSSLEQSTSSNTRKSKHHHKAVPAQSCPPAEPVIKHNAEKLKSSNFKYRVYPLLKMNDTDINDSVLDMTVSQMNICSPTRRPSPPQSSIKLITWKDTQQQNEQILTSNVSKNSCLPFTVNLVDSEPKFQINNNDMNIIEYENNDSETANGLSTIPEEEPTYDDGTVTTYIDVLPTILEETESSPIVTIKPAISSSKMCDDTDDDEQFIEYEEDIAEENPEENADENTEENAAEHAEENTDENTDENMDENREENAEEYAEENAEESAKEFAEEYAEENMEENAEEYTEENRQIVEVDNAEEGDDEASGNLFQEAYSLEFIEEFRSSTPFFNETDSDSIRIRNETENSISFDISPILKPVLYETPVTVERKPSFPDVVEVLCDNRIVDEKNAPKTPQSTTSENRRTKKIFTEDVSEQEWQDFDDYYEDQEQQNNEYYEDPEQQNNEYFTDATVAAPEEEEEDWLQNERNSRVKHKSKRCNKKPDDYYEEEQQLPKNKKRKHGKDAKILDKFLKEKKNNCRLEVEIIANETRPKNQKSNLNLYRVNSSEIVIRGDRCIDALNKSFLRNKIKHVNIVFINEDTKDESEITLKSDLNAKKYKDTFVINTEIPMTKKSARKLIGSKDRAHRRDNFWDQYTQNDYDDNFVTENDDDDDDCDSEHNLTLPPINIKKKKNPEQSYEYINSQRINETPTRFPPIHEDKNQSINQKEKDDYDPFLIAEKQLMELLQGDDFKPYKNTSKTPSPKTKLKSLPLSKPKSSKTTQKPAERRASLIDPPNIFQDKINSLQDNFEMIENFINDNFVTTNEIKRKFSDEINSIDPKLINENDNLKIPDQLMIDNYSPISYNNDVDHYSAQYDKHIAILEPLVLPKTEMKRSHSHLTDADFEEFISSFDDDDDGLPTLKHFLNAAPQTKKKSFNCSFGKGTTKNSENKKHPLSPLKRSVSLSNPVVKARSMKNKQDIQDYLHVREQKPSREKLKALSPRSSDELFPVGHEMYNEYKKYEETYRREQNDDEAHERDENDDVSSNEDSTPPLPERNYHNHNQQKMQAGDSAYGRKSPKSQQVSQHRQSKTQHVKRSPSSSGSETCTSLPTKKNNRLTKFCHECGTKYPLDCAKFCVECGIKRLVL